MKFPIAEILLALTMSDDAGIKVDPSEAVCLARNVYHEARGESQAGQRAVAYVALNRVGKPGRPETVCGVVYQKGPQFGWTVKSEWQERPAEPAAYENAMMVALNALAGRTVDPTHGATYFYDHTRVNPSWAREMDVAAVIGGHKFLSE